MVRPRTRANVYNKEEELHFLQKLKNVQQETFGRALERMGRDELPDNADECSTGKERKGMKEMNDKYYPLSANDIREAMSEITNALKKEVFLTQKVGRATSYATSNKIQETSPKNWSRL